MVDTARLWRAQIDGLFRPIQSKNLESRIPENLRAKSDTDGITWFGFSTRARLIVYNKSLMNPKDIDTYEKLAEAHGIKISTESVRQILIAEGLHKAKVQKDKGVHVWRERKHHAGEMVQIDGSHHRWLEGRLDQEFCLMAYIDDATSKVFARFYEYEGVLPVLDSFEGFVRENGIPISVYLDRHSTYKVNRKTTIEEDLEGEGALTQFQLVMKQLGVKVIYARSPQAKGRVERLFETLQDRLVKELRLAGVTTIEGANEFLIPYLEKHNSQFQFTP